MIQGFVNVILYTLSISIHKYYIRIIHFSPWALYEFGNCQRA